MSTLGQTQEGAKCQGISLGYAKLGGVDEHS
jgi:hypothetical protein